MKVCHFDKIFASLIVYRHNLHILHWKISGHNFEDMHKLLDDYVSKFNSFIDEIGEMMLSLNCNPLALSDCIHILENDEEYFLMLDPSEDYDMEDALSAMDKMFTDMMVMYMTLYKEVELPDDCKSKLDEHRYWFRIENSYKNKRRMI